MKTKLLCLLLILSACVRHPREFDHLLAQSEHTVLMFLAPDCPLCLTFSKPFNALAMEYPEVQFLGVLSGENYSAEEVAVYREKSGFDKRILSDADHAIARQLEATVTPEFFVLDREGRILYRGLLDDRMERLGVYKQHWEHYYLADALQAVSKGETAAIQRTEPVGCVLEY